MGCLVAVRTAMLKSYFLPGVDVLSITFNSAYALLEEYTVPSYACWEFCRMSFHGFRENEEKRRYKYHKAWTIGRYILLTMVISPLFFGSITL